MALEANRRVLLPPALENLEAPPESSDYVNLHGLSMGTSWQVQLYLPPDQGQDSAIEARIHELQQGIQAQLDLVVAQMSPWESDSDLMRFNRAAAGTWHSFPSAFCEVLEHALFLAEQTQGAYDPSIGHLADLWGFGAAGKVATCPSKQHIQAAVALTNWRVLRYQKDRDNRQGHCFQAGSIHLDLCSTAKGYGVDLVARYLRTEKIPSYLIEVGGELRGWGMKPNYQPWWVELENPPEQTQHTQHTQHKHAADIVALHGLSIASSGDYRRYFEVDQQRFSHTIDPRTGYPVQHGLCSVTVLHPECMIADALATAISVLGPDHGLAYAQSLQVAARLVVREHDQHGIAHYREILSPAYLHMLDDTSELDETANESDDRTKTSAFNS